MTLPRAVRQRIDEAFEAFCEQREAEKARAHERVEYKVSVDNVVVTDSKPEDLSYAKWSHRKVANFEFNAGTGKWTLSWYDKNSKRHPYPLKTSEASLEELLQVVENDCTGVFWY